MGSPDVPHRVEVSPLGYRQISLRPAHEPRFPTYRVDRRLNELGGFWAEEFGVPDVGEDREAGLREIFQEVMAVERDGVA